jgi:hypothetical protein
MDEKSGVPFKVEDRAALLHKPILSKDCKDLSNSELTIDKTACKGLNALDCLKKAFEEPNYTSPPAN